ncbi:MAG TPA: hypothetical protein VFG64_18400 [Dongiaceae bacterium]|nr:hypothetical protein [Dongiaceae bacterium]
MTTRTIKSTVTFKSPFSLSGFDGEQPAGTYSVETDEELLEGVSFPAYRRMATMMQIEPASLSPGGALQVAVIDPQQLKAALAMDAAHSEAHDQFVAWRARNMWSAANPKR